MTIQLKKWTNKFGREYTDRNPATPEALDRLYKVRLGVTRTALNNIFLGRMDRSIKILEIGSNTGMQLALLQRMGFKNLYGIEPQDYAVKTCKARTRNIHLIEGNVFELPFSNGHFDLVFTSGVLIHINPKDIERAMREIHRCSSRYIWGYEYYSKQYKEITYKGEKNLLWKADFTRLYLELFSDLQLIEEKRLTYLESNKIDTMFLLKKSIKNEAKK